MGRRLLVVAACALVCVGAGAFRTATCAAWTKTDQMRARRATARSSPRRSTCRVGSDRRPAAGRRSSCSTGFGGTRASMNAIAEQTFATQGFAVLTSDHRGHGAVGRALRRRRAARDPGRARPLRLARRATRHRQGARRRLGHLARRRRRLGRAEGRRPVRGRRGLRDVGRSVPRRSRPDGLTKSGAIFQFLSSRRRQTARRSELNSLEEQHAQQHERRDDARSCGRRSARRQGRAARRSRRRCFVFQGRRDFAFGLEQGLTAYRQLGGPKRLYIGDFGHAPSTFPGPDADAVFAESTAWFARFLKNHAERDRHAQAGRARARSRIATGHNVSYAGLPADDDREDRDAARRARRSARAASSCSTFALPKRKLEVFGAPVVTVKASTRTQAKQLVAVLEAVAAAAAPRRSSARAARCCRRGRRRGRSRSRSSHDTALIARGSKLRLTLSWTSTAQNPVNLLYLTGVPDGSSLTIKSASITLARAQDAGLRMKAARRSRSRPRARDVRVRRRRRRTRASPSTSILLGGTAALSGPESAYYAPVAQGRAGVLRLRQRARRRLRAQDRLQGRRRRVRPGADGAGDAPARAAGPRLRDLQLDRHRAHARGAAVPEPGQGAAALRRHGSRAVLQPGRSEYPWTMGFLPSFYGEGALYGRYIAAHVAEGEDRRALRERRLRQGPARRAAKGLHGKAKIVGTASYELTDADMSAQIAALKATRANTLALFALPKQVIQAFLAAHKLGWKAALLRQRGLDRPVRDERRRREHEQADDGRRDQLRVPQGRDRSRAREGQGREALQVDHEDATAPAAT